MSEPEPTRLDKAVTELGDAMMEELGAGDNPQAKMAVAALAGQVHQMVAFLKGAKTTPASTEPSLLE